MKRILLAITVMAPLLLAACGPDCQAFCKHWVGDCACADDEAQCLHGCNEVGGDNVAFIKCGTDHSCDKIRSGHCVPTGRSFPKCG